MITLSIATRNHAEMCDITAQVRTVIHETGINNGAVVVYSPHTTCGITINEHADPDVARDMLHILDTVFPWNGSYHHREGNAAAHMKTAAVGTSVTVIIENGDIQLGTWQGIFLCEFDGPRSRNVWIQPVGERKD